MMSNSLGLGVWDIPGHWMAILDIPQIIRVEQPPHMPCICIVMQFVPMLLTTFFFMFEVVPVVHGQCMMWILGPDTVNGDCYNGQQNTLFVMFAGHAT